MPGAFAANGFDDLSPGGYNLAACFLAEVVLTAVFLLVIMGPPEPEGRVLCSHEIDGDRACATKLLWTRVQGGVNRALAGTTLAELAEFAEQPSGGTLAGQAA